MKTYLTHKSIFEKVIDFMARTIPYKEYEPKPKCTRKRPTCPTYNVEYDKKNMTRWEFLGVYKCWPELYPF
jgi:hypothetical protein